MKRLFGKRSEETTPADEKEEQAAGKPAAPGTAKEKGAASPADDDQEQYADDPASGENEDPNVDDNDEDDPKKGKKKAGKGKPGLAVKDAVEEAAKITDLCTLFGNPGLASGFIRKGLSSSAVQRHLLTMRNEDADAEQASGGTLSTAHTGERAKPRRLVEGMQDMLKQKGLIH